MSQLGGDDEALAKQDADADPKAGQVEADRGNETDISPPRGHSFPIVGIGASAGGLDAFKRLLQALPDDTDMAFVFVQHLDPSHASQLPEILAAATSMPVHNVEDGMHIRPNEVFVIPPNATMVLEDGVLRLEQRNRGLHLPVDAFFESLARIQGSRAIGIVLSGNASDGSQGVRAIKGECGLTFAQDEASAQHVGMPRNAISTGAIDYVLPPADIARELVRLSQHPFVRTPQPGEAEAEILPDGERELHKVFHVLRNRTKVDFSHYKPNTVRRRIGRRMIVRQTRSLSEYAQLLEKQPDEARELYRDLLINVTNFFRDPEVFEALGRLFRDVLQSRDANEAFRVWVPGCASGEEVYSLAICLKEVIDDLQLSTPMQLFGTDISDLALERARAAYYPESIAQDISAERLRRYFVRVDRGHQVSKSIREACVFARQDVTADPPFAHVDLLSCRNLLIYLDAVLQRKVLPVFHYSLNPTGMLVLGSAESIGPESDLFSVIDKQNKIYGRKPVTMPRLLSFPLALKGSGETTTVRQRTALSGLDLQKKADLVIQSKYSPAAVVVDGDMQILHFRGRTGFYLEPTHGEAHFSLLRMVREGMVGPLRRAVEAAGSQNISVREAGVVVEYLGERREIAIEVTPIAGESPSERYFVIVFQEALPQPNPPVALQRPAAGESSDYAASLEALLAEQQKQAAEMREHLRNANEDHEAHTEELQAANEEIRSANEELQSTNEELSTTKEELQSANEELNTLNEELQNRNSELNTANSDLQTLLSATDVAFLMVDNELRLRRFSATAEKFLDVKAIDIGHPVSHLQGRIDFKEFQAVMRRVVESLGAEHREVQDTSGHWFSVTIRPYRTLDNRIAGAVLVFVDINVLKRNLQIAEQARDYAESLIETVREPLVVLDGDLRVQRATATFYEAFRVSRAETEGRFLYDLGNGQWNIPRLRELLGESLFGDDPFHDFEVEHVFPHIGRRRMRLNGRKISPDGEPSRSVLLAIEDVTEQRQEAEIRYQRLFETAKDGMLIFDAETERLTDVNPYFLQLTSSSREQLIGRQLSEMDSIGISGDATDIVRQAKLQEVARNDSVELNPESGRRIQADWLANRYSVGGQQVVQINVRDVTARNNAFRELRDSEERFRLFVESVRDYALFQMDLSGVISSWNSGAERMLGYTEEDILGAPVSIIFTPEDLAKGAAAQEIETALTTGSSEDERWHVRKDGSRFFASGVLTTVNDQTGRLRGLAKVMRDVTERTKAEERLREQAQLLELAQDLIVVRKLDGTILFWNHAAGDKYGWTREEAAGKNIHQLLETQFPEPLADIEKALLEQGRWEGELVHRRCDDCPMTVWSRWALQFDSVGNPSSVLEINSDITDRKHSDEQLHASLREKEVLLKEVHHRVKNNLQIIASLLNLQAEFLADKNAQAMLEEMNTRVRSIASIHEMLYSATDLSRIDFAHYVTNLAKDVLAVYSNRASGVRVNIDAEQVSLEITQAVPCGLIVNELLTNGLKHAFPGNRAGSMVVSVRCPDDDECVLEVSDNGVGLPPNFDFEASKSMGFQLLTLLVRQLNGKLQIDRSEGTRFRIEFPRKLSDRKRLT